VATAGVEWLTSAGDGVPFVAGSDRTEDVYFVHGGVEVVLDSTDGINDARLFRSSVSSGSWGRFFLCFPEPNQQGVPRSVATLY
jgi:hypothetical protein